MLGKGKSFCLHDLIPFVPLEKRMAVGYSDQLYLMVKHFYSDRSALVQDNSVPTSTGHAGLAVWLEGYENNVKSYTMAFTITRSQLRDLNRPPSTKQHLREELLEG